MKIINKTIKKFAILPIALGAAFFAMSSQQAKAADTVVGLSMQDYASVSATANITVTPTLAQVAAGTVTTATNPITLTINSTNGSDITLEGDGSDGTGGTLADADLSLSSDGGTTWVAASDNNATTFYTSSATQNAATVGVKVKINNLGNYAVGTHNNTVTFTITDNS